ncbi:FecCD family ABC transporter permease [Corynebacterium choanae]|nr:iron ABC transporter permease [Corynebacterium choanae]
MIANIAIGQYTLSLPAIIEQFRVMFTGDAASDPTAYGVLFTIRLPRVVLGMLVGAALAVAGAVLQGLLANPLAEPGVIGVTSGAGVGAAAAIVFGWTFLGIATVPCCAFIAGMFTTWLVYRLARADGTVKITSLILTGIAINAVGGALISFLIFVASTTAREQIIFWQMGSLNGAKWEQVYAVVVPIVAGCAVACWIAPQLDVLALGERAARHAGVHVTRLRPLVVALATALAAAAVSFAGIIGFIGLIVPHILRQALGPTHTWLVPLSAVGGAVLVTAADLLARTMIAYAELPIGMLTAIVGGPVFFWLLRRNLAVGGVR